MATQSGLTIVGRYSYLYEADGAKALLDSEGIQCWLLDEHQIQHRWHLGNALGGVKLAVAAESAERAMELLAHDFSESLEAIPEQDLPGHADELCPNCSTTAESVSEQRMPGPFQWAASLVFLFLGALVPHRRFEVNLRCRACGHSWSRTDHR